LLAIRFARDCECGWLKDKYGRSVEDVDDVHVLHAPPLYVLKPKALARGDASEKSRHGQCNISARDDLGLMEAQEWKVDLGFRMSSLAMTFPTLRDADGIVHWDPNAFEEWLVKQEPQSAARWAGRFLLSVWTPTRAWVSGRFVRHEALACWDENHRRAFAVWCQDPWWPRL
jgi:hypothetical protein